MALGMVVGGIILWMLMNGLTKNILARIDPNPDHHYAVFSAVAGTGVVPAWISFLHVVGTASTLLGVILLFAR